MGTKKQESLKKTIFKDTKAKVTTSDMNPDIDISLMEAFGMKFKFDESKDYFRKTDKEIKLLKEEQLKEDHKVTAREKKSFIITMMENLTDAQIDGLYTQVEEMVGDGGTA